MSELRLWCNSSIFSYCLSLQMTFHLSWSCSIILYGRELPEEMPCVRWFGCPRSCREQPGHWEATWGHGSGRAAVTSPRDVYCNPDKNTDRGAVAGVGSAGGKPGVGGWVDLGCEVFPLYVFLFSWAHQKTPQAPFTESPLFRRWL